MVQCRGTARQQSLGYAGPDIVLIERVIGRGFSHTPALVAMGLSIPANSTEINFSATLDATRCASLTGTALPS